jgi:uncharacterized protein YcbX
MSTRIQALHLYPIKGCRGFAVDVATLAPTGLEVDGVGDREWVVVDDENEFLSQRELPRMALIETRLTASSLRIKAPGMLALDIPLASEGDVVPVRVWNDTVSAVTQDPLIDTWLSNYLERPARLMRFDPEHRRLAAAKFTGKHEAPYKFADAFPLLVTTQASLADLNARLARRGHPAVTMQRFRPNVVLDGIEAFEEDYVDELRVGGSTLRFVKPCARCTVPGVDPATGLHDPTVSDVLAEYRRSTNEQLPGVMFGANAIVVEGHDVVLRTGMDVGVALKV